MKTIILSITFICFSFFAFGQKLELNENGFYECTTIINYKDAKLLESLKARILSLNYNIIQVTDSLIIASRLSSEGALSGQNIKYNVSLELRENKYRVIFTNFIIYTTSTLAKETHLEKIIFKQSWIKQIDKELPKLVGELDLNTAKEKKDW